MAPLRVRQCHGGEVGIRRECVTAVCTSGEPARRRVSAAIARQPDAAASEPRTEPAHLPDPGRTLDITVDQIGARFFTGVDGLRRSDRPEGAVAIAASICQSLGRAEGRRRHRPCSRCQSPGCVTPVICIPAAAPVYHTRETPPPKWVRDPGQKLSLEKPAAASIGGRSGKRR